MQAKPFLPSFSFLLRSKTWQNNYFSAQSCFAVNMCLQQKINSKMWLTPFYIANLLLIEKKIICKPPYNANTPGWYFLSGDRQKYWSIHTFKYLCTYKMYLEYLLFFCYRLPNTLNYIFAATLSTSVCQKRPELREIIKINALQFVRQRRYNTAKNYTTQ